MSKICNPRIEDIPLPPKGKVGWPWTETSDNIPEKRSDGTDWPKITIVTPSFQQGHYIEETIRSVLLQGYPNLEFFIVDGGSTDATLDIVRSYDDFISFWVSEPDDGQADAINKGLEKASGDIFNWVNSDDLLLPNALWTVAVNYKSGRSVAGSVQNFGGERPKIITNRGLSICEYLTGNPLNFNFHQPGFFLETQAAKSIFFDKDFHYCFDLLFTFKYVQRYGKPVFIDNVLTQFRIHDESKTHTSQEKFRVERIEILKLLEEDPDFYEIGKKIRTVRIAREDALFLDDALVRPSVAALFSIFLFWARRPFRRLNRYTLGAIRQILLLIFYTK